MMNIILKVKARAEARFGMGHSRIEKANSRERILKAAAAQVRDAGLESVSVGALMRSVGLTHGGFYGHFASRSDLLAQALERALEEGEVAARAAADPSRPFDYAAGVRSYLSRRHRDSRASGCAIAALASDVARADEASRRVMESHLDAFAAKVSAATGGDEDKALFAVSAMIGALLVSRVITDSKRSDALLRTAREQVTALGEGTGAQA